MYDRIKKLHELNVEKMFDEDLKVYYFEYLGYR